MKTKEYLIKMEKNATSNVLIEWKMNIVKNLIVPKMIYRFNAIPK